MSSSHPMPHPVRLVGLLAASALISACASSGIGLGFPECVPDQRIAEAPKVKAGDTWTYRQTDDYTGIDQGTFRIEATGSDATEIQAQLTRSGGPVSREFYDAQWGWKTVSNRGWDWLSRLAYGSQTVEFRPAFGSMPFPLQIGNAWSDTVIAINPATRAQIPIQLSSNVRCWEQITVPAGTFTALRIERTAYIQDVAWNKSQTTLRMVDWYLPAVNRVVMTWHDSYFYDYQQSPRNALVRGDRLRWQLIEYRAQ